MFYYLNEMKEKGIYYKKFLASENWFKQIFGAMLKRWQILLSLFVMMLLPFFVWIYNHLPESVILNLNQDCAHFVQKACIVSKNHWYQLLFLTLLVCLAISVCRTLTNICSLRKKETGITWCQITILIAIGLWIVGIVAIFDIQHQTRYAAAFGIVGSILTWIFQDTIKGVASFIQLRMNHLLCIDDWIQIPKYNIDGTVTRVSLTTVTIYNWDTTTSSIPTSVLHSDHFINLQKMKEGKTYGRRMFKKFILDTGRFHMLTKEDVAQLKQSAPITQYLPAEEIKEGMTNAQLFRQYLFHWLMNHPHVSQQPCLIVRWMEHIESGLPLQVYAFITESSLTSFELQQSQIIEHIIESLEWFGLRLFQNPSSYDVSNNKYFIIDENLQE